MFRLGLELCSCVTYYINDYFRKVNNEDGDSRVEGDIDFVKHDELDINISGKFEAKRKFF